MWSLVTFQQFSLPFLVANGSVPLTKPSSSRVSFLMELSHRISFHPSTPFWEHLSYFVSHLHDSLWLILGNFSLLLNSWVQRRPVESRPSPNHPSTSPSIRCKEKSTAFQVHVCSSAKKRSKGEAMSLPIFFSCLSFSFLHDFLPRNKVDLLRFFFFFLVISSPLITS